MFKVLLFLILLNIVYAEDKVIVAVAKLIETGHISHPKIDDNYSKKVLNRYLLFLDPSRLFLSQEDVASFESAYGDKLDDSLKAGDDSIPFQIFEEFKKRVNQRFEISKAWVKEANSENLEKGDYEDRPEWLSHDKLALGWRQKLTNDYLFETLGEGGTKVDAETAKERILRRQKQVKNAVNDQTHDDIVSLFLLASARASDPHSDYLAPKELEEMQNNMRLSVVGIGVQLFTEDGYVKISQIIPGGPAASSDIDVGDKIIGVAQGDGDWIQTFEMRVDKITDLVRGKIGTKVRLLLLTPSGNRKEVSLIRNEIKNTSAEAKGHIVNVDGLKLGVLELPSFYAEMDNKGQKSCAKDVEIIINKLKSQKVAGILFDLRNNGGGVLDEGVNIAGFFIKTGPVVMVSDGKQVQIYGDRNPAIQYDGPLVVLMSRTSASASEIVAAALQDYKRALIVGCGSFGKGTVQSVLEVNRVVPFLSDSAGALKLTIQNFYRITGSSTQLVGVKPDITLPVHDNLSEIGEASLNEPLPHDVIKTSSFNLCNNINDKIISALGNQSHIRQQTNVGLQNIIRELKHASEPVHLDISSRGAFVNKAVGTFPWKSEPVTIRDFEVFQEDSSEAYDPVEEESLLILKDLVNFGK